MGSAWFAVCTSASFEERCVDSIFHWVLYVDVAGKALCRLRVIYAAGFWYIFAPEGGPKGFMMEPWGGEEHH